MITDGVKAKAGTITAPFDRFSAWKKINIHDEVIENRELDTMMYGLFNQGRMLDLVRNFTVFTNEAKILAAYHQYYGMKKALDSTIRASGNRWPGRCYLAYAR